MTLSDGASVAAHQASADRQAAMFGIKLKGGGITTEPVPRLPRLLGYVWDMFCEISGGIQGNGWSHPVVTWESLKAWADETDQHLDPRDARVVIQLGQRRASVLNASLGKKNAGKD